MLALASSTFPRAPRGGEQVAGCPARGESQRSEGDGLKPAAGLCWDTLGLRVSGGGWDEPGWSREAHASSKWRSRASSPAGLGAGRGGHDRRTKPRIYSLPSFHRQPLSASLRWIVPAFSLLQLFTGSPWCRHAHKERATGEAVPVPPALRVPLRPREHSGAIDPAGRACPGPGWAGGMQTHPGHPLLHRLWPWDCKEGAPKGLGLAALPLFGHTRFGGGNGS